MTLHLFIRPSFFYFLIYEKIFKMLESGGRNKNKDKNSKIEESKKKKKKKKELNNNFFFLNLLWRLNQTLNTWCYNLFKFKNFK